MRILASDPTADTLHRLAHHFFAASTSCVPRRAFLQVRLYHEHNLKLAAPGAEGDAMRQFMGIAQSCQG